MENQIGKYHFKFKKIGGKEHIFDPVRKKYILFTPEEKVRQYFISYLTTQLDYPKGFIKVESGLQHNQLNKRSDILIYNKDFTPSMLVECKSEKVKLDKSTLEQISFYNQVYQVKILVITNGVKTYPMKLDTENKKYQPIQYIPPFKLL
ncbi:MAG: type I restriction enzyme HsdR N-terminal domain-containing protein [Chitinophagales bacterium]|nr:type I restriction enzyme HsdR N-terminal domain-containing protein [Chitinophagales bacterium]